MERDIGTRRPAGSGVRWRDARGRPLSCEEKLKVLEENLAEMRQVCQDAFEDALLMDCDESQIREVFQAVVSGLRNPFAGDSAAGAAKDAPAISADDSAASLPAPDPGHRRRS